MAFEALEITPDELEQRKEWASRNGKMRWLWPEIAPEEWRGALQALEGVARNVLGGRPARLEHSESLLALSLAAYTSGIGPLAGYWIEQGRVRADPQDAALLALHLDHNRRRMDALAGHAARIVGGLVSSGIDTIVLKGMDLAFTCYPEPGTRPVSDVDLLVGAGGPQRQAAQLLAEDGFEITSQNFRETTWMQSSGARAVRSLLFTHADDPWAIDLHHRLDEQATRGAPITSLDRFLPGMQKRGWPLHPHASTLAQPALLLQLAVHIGASVRINTSLVRLVDLVLVIRRDAQAGCLDWRAFVELARDSGSLDLAFPGLALAEKLAPGTVPPEILAACTRNAGRSLRNLVRDLSPAGAQRIDRISMRDRYIWAKGPLALLGQIGADLVPDMPWRETRARYGRVLRTALRGGFIR